jgi:uncharacterized protein YndB with AHSA1/START domain
MELTVHRTLPYPLGRVWSALTDAAALAGWFWPERLQAVADVDLQPGGAWRIAGLGIAVSGRYAEVELAHRLVSTWQWDGDDLVTTVTMTLATGTELTLIHTGFPDEAARDDHVKGWSDCLDRLSEWLADSPERESEAG